MTNIPPISQASSFYTPPEAELQRVVDEHCKGYPAHIGCNVLVMREGKEPLLYRGGDIPMNAQINWGSVSKQFTAACIDKLVKLGKLKYDDDIRTVCPGLPELKLNGVVQRVTVDDLLHMRSGLPEVWGTALMKGQDAEKLENTTLLGFLNEHPGMIFAPGTKFMYCNTNYYVLAKIVENVSKRPFFPDFVREEVLRPLGMEARCSIDPSSPATIPGYELENNVWKDVTSTNKTYGTTGLIGPPSDMRAWNEAISRRDYDLLEPPQKRESTEPNYCRGVYVDFVDDYTVIHHGGALSGAVAIYCRYEHRADPSKTFALFFTTNADDVPAAEKTTNHIARAIAGKDLSLPQSQIQALPKRIATLDEVKPYCGKFRCRELGSEWLIKEEDLKGNWGLRMSPAVGGFPTSWIFTPQIQNEHPIFKATGFGNPSLELTQTGFTLYSDKLAPLHFDRHLAKI